MFEQRSKLERVNLARWIILFFLSSWDFGEVLACGMKRRPRYFVEIQLGCSCAEAL